MGMPEIRFNHHCLSPQISVRVFFTNNDSRIDTACILLLDSKSSKTIDWETVSLRDQNKIIARIEDWVVHYKNLSSGEMWDDKQVRIP